MNNVNVKQIVKLGLHELGSCGIADRAPKREVFDGKEVKEELVILFQFGKIFQHLHLFTILFKFSNQVFDLVVLLSILHGEDDTKRVGTFECSAGPQAFVLTQGRLCAPTKEGLFQIGLIRIG